MKLDALTEIDTIFGRMLDLESRKPGMLKDDLENALKEEKRVVSMFFFFFFFFFLFVSDDDNLDLKMDFVGGDVRVYFGRTNPADLK
jgi:hypothetical protein